MNHPHYTDESALDQSPTSPQSGHSEAIGPRMRIEQLGEQSQLVVHGQVGVGKTSLLSAWVIPTLMESRADE